MVNTYKDTFHDCLNSEIDVLLENFIHVVETASLQQASPNSEALEFKDKYKTFQEQRSLSGATANIFNSASILLGLCAETKREILINNFLRETPRAKARSLTLLKHQEKTKAAVKNFSQELDELVSEMEDALYSSPYQLNPSLLNQ